MPLGHASELFVEAPVVRDRDRPNPPELEVAGFSDPLRRGLGTRPQSTYETLDQRRQAINALPETALLLEGCLNH